MQQPTVGLWGHNSEFISRDRGLRCFRNSINIWQFTHQEAATNSFSLFLSNTLPSVFLGSFTWKTCLSISISLYKWLWKWAHSNFILNFYLHIMLNRNLHRFWSILTWHHHTVTAGSSAAHAWFESPIPPHPKGTMLDWDVVTAVNSPPC